MSDGPTIRAGDEVLLRGVVTYTAHADGKISVDLSGGGRAYIAPGEAEKVIHRHRIGDRVTIPATPAGKAPGKIITVTSDNEWAVVDIGGGAPVVVGTSAIERIRAAEDATC